MESWRGRRWLTLEGATSQRSRSALNIPQLPATQCRGSPNEHPSHPGRPNYPKKGISANEKAQWVESLAAKPDDRSLIARAKTHTHRYTKTNTRRFHPAPLA